MECKKVMGEQHAHAVQANATMRRTLRPSKPSVTTTGNKMLDIAIRMAGTLEQQEKDAADALLAQSVACRTLHPATAQAACERHHCRWL